VPEVKARLEGLGLDIIGGSAESFGKTIQTDVAKWSQVVRDANIKPQ
jgi:tripartite-type tricarboxylate transporter receptor subunit TctC